MQVELHVAAHAARSNAVDRTTARERARDMRTWADVARETRAAWSDAARQGPLL